LSSLRFPWLYTSVGAGLEGLLALFLSLFSILIFLRKRVDIGTRSIFGTVFSPGFFPKGLGDWSSVNYGVRTWQEITSGEDIFYPKRFPFIPHDSTLGVSIKRENRKDRENQIRKPWLRRYVEGEGKI